MKTRNLLEFKKLPKKTKEAVRAILEHRDLTYQYMVGGTSGTILGELAALGQIATRETIDLTSEPYIDAAKLVAAGTAVGTTVTALAFKRGMNSQTRLDYLRLYRALREDLRDPLVATILKSGSPYLIVDRQGNLVTKKSAPQLSKTYPIGRRRVINPYNPNRRKKIKQVASWMRHKLPK